MPCAKAPRLLDDKPTLGANRPGRVAADVYLWACGFRACVEGSGNGNVCGSSARASGAGWTASVAFSSLRGEPRAPIGRLVGLKGPIRTGRHAKDDDRARRSRRCSLTKPAVCRCSIAVELDEEGQSGRHLSQTVLPIPAVLLRRIHADLAWQHGVSSDVQSRWMAVARVGTRCEQRGRFGDLA